MKESNDITIIEALQQQVKLKGKNKKKVRADQSNWRSISAINKLHNIAVFIRNSDIYNNV